METKGKNVVIIGGGDTGNDCVGTVIRHGCKSVVQLEMMPKAPDERSADNPWPEYPRVCKTDYGQEEAIAVFGQDPRIYQTTVKRVITGEDGAIRAIETIRMDYDEAHNYRQVEGRTSGLRSADHRGRIRRLQKLCDRCFWRTDNGQTYDPDAAGPLCVQRSGHFYGGRCAPRAVPGGMGHCGRPGMRERSGCLSGRLF